MSVVATPYEAKCKPTTLVSQSVTARPLDIRFFRAATYVGDNALHPQAASVENALDNAYQLIGEASTTEEAETKLSLFRSAASNWADSDD